jgi:hypothetical protein
VNLLPWYVLTGALFGLYAVLSADLLLRVL